MRQKAGSTMFVDKAATHVYTRHRRGLRRKPSLSSNPTTSLSLSQSLSPVHHRHVKVQKPLNPKAEEWRPPPPPPPPPPQASPLLPHAVYQPHPPSLSAPPPPQTQMLPYHPQPCYTLLAHYPQHPPPVYTISFPAKVADSVAPPICVENPENLEMDREVKSAVFRRPKGRKNLRPPRLRRATRSRTQSHPPPPPPPPKLKWWPKTSGNSNVKVSGAAASPPTTPKTTLMIKNIPNQLRRDYMLNFLDAQCNIHSLEYDFFYLPFDFRSRGNLGYVFVNCTTSDAAMKMKKVLDNFEWRFNDGYVYSSKVCEMTWARIQGKEALVRRFQKSSFKCDNWEFLPIVLDPPRDGSDPNPPPPLNLGRLCPRASS